jgi:hypothetical protein
MKKIMVLLIINMFLLTNIYSINRQDSIYHDLYLFLVSQGEIKQEQISELGTDNYDQYIYLFDIRLDDFPNKPDLDTPFGIYKFNYNGHSDGGYYVLIKHNEIYKVYDQNALSLIIRELIQIKKENPDLIDNNLFNTYLERITDDKLGLNTSHYIIVQKIEVIEYCR